MTGLREIIERLKGLDFTQFRGMEFRVFTYGQELNAPFKPWSAAEFLDVLAGINPFSILKDFDNWFAAESAMRGVAKSISYSTEASRKEFARLMAEIRYRVMTTPIREPRGMYIKGHA